MDKRTSISNVKRKLLIFLTAFLISIIALQPKQTVYAGWAQGAAGFVNSTHSDETAGTTEIRNGVSVERTGYLAYMVNKETGAPTSDAIAFSAGDNWIGGSQWIVSSRHGGLTGSPNMKEAKWGKPWIPPAYKGDTLKSLEPNIKQWFRTQGSDFVNKEFPANHSNFVADTEVLVLETIMNVQFSINASNNAEARNLCEQEAVNRLAPYSMKELCQIATSFGHSLAYANYCKWKSEVDNGNYSHADDLDDLLTEIYDGIKDAIVDILLSSGFAGEGREYLGDPVIGTVPNLLQYDTWGTTVFDTYLNNGAPQAEKIVYSEAGFTAYPGSGKLTDAEVQQYGVAMIIIHCTDPAQTTCDETLLPTPHNPPKESQGHTTIVKSYRTKDPAGKLIDDGTYSTPDLGTQILIENEQTYQVIGWKTSTTTNTNIKSTSWNPPSSVVQQGTTPNSVTLDPQETCLYVLLEKVESEPQEEEDYNYLLSESSITRTVWFSNPDYNKLGNMNNPEWIYQHKFNWASPATPYCEGHGYYKACATHHTGGTCNCSGLCSSGCTDLHHLDTCDTNTCTTSHGHKTCTTTHYWNCGSDDCELNNLKYISFLEHQIWCYFFAYSMGGH